MMIIAGCFRTGPVSLVAERIERVDMMFGPIRREAAEYDALERGELFSDRSGHRADRNTRGAVGRETIDARGDRGKGNGAQLVLRRELESRAVAGCQELILPLVAPAPHRPDRMNDVGGLEPVPARDLGGAGLTAAELFAFAFEIGSGGAMDRAVHSSAAQQRAIGCVDDTMDVQRGDGGHPGIKPGGG